MKAAAALLLALAASCMVETPPEMPPELRDHECGVLCANPVERCEGSTAEGCRSECEHYQIGRDYCPGALQRRR